MADVLEAGQAVIELRAIGDQLRADLEDQSKMVLGKLGEIEKQGAASFDVVKIGAGAAAAATKIAAGVLTAYTGALIAVGKASIDSFADFEEGFANVATLLTQLGEPIEPIREQLLALNPALGSAAELSEALYQALSAGVEPALAVEAVAQSAALAKVAIGDLGSTVTLTAGIINGFGKTAVGGFEEVGQVLNTIVAQGVVKLETLAQVLPAAGAAAIGANGDFEDLARTFGFLTQAGLPAAQAATALKAIFSELSKPGKELGEALESAGLSGEALGKALQEDGGLVDVLRRVKDAAEKSGSTLNETFSSREALSGINFIARDFDNAAQKVATFSEALRSGITVQELFEQRTDNLRSKQEALANSVERAEIALGARLAPVLTALTSNLSDVTEQVGEFVTVNGELLEQNVDQAIAGINAGFDILNLLLPEILAGWAGLPGAIGRGAEAAGNFLKTITAGRVDLNNFIADLKSLRETNEQLDLTGINAERLKLVAAQEKARGEVEKITKSLDTFTKTNDRAIASAKAQGEVIAGPYAGSIARLQTELAGATEKQKAATAAIEAFKNGAKTAAEAVDVVAAASSVGGAALATMGLEGTAAADALKDLGGEAKKAAPKIDEVGDSLGGVGDSLGGVGGGAKKVTEEVLKLNAKLADVNIARALDALRATEDLGSLKAAVEAAKEAIEKAFDAKAEAELKGIVDEQEIAATRSLLAAERLRAIEGVQIASDRQAETIGRNEERNAKAVEKTAKEVAKLTEEFNDAAEAARAAGKTIAKDFSKALLGAATGKNSSSKIGETLIQGFSETIEDGFADQVTDAFEDAFSDLTEALVGPGSAVDRIGEELLDPLGESLSKTIGLLTDPMLDAFDELLGAILPDLSSIFDDLFSDLVDPVTEIIGDFLGEAVSAVGDFAVDAFSGLGSLLGGSLSGGVEEAGAIAGDAAAQVGEDLGEDVAEGATSAIGSIGVVGAVAAGFVAVFQAVAKDSTLLSDVQFGKQFADQVAELVTDAFQDETISDAINKAAGQFGLTFSEGIAQTLAGFQANFEEIFIRSILPTLRLAPGLLEEITPEFGFDSSFANVFDNVTEGVQVFFALLEKFPDVSEDFLKQIAAAISDPTAGAVTGSPTDFFQFIFGADGDTLSREIARDLGDLTTQFGIAAADMQGIFGPERGAEIAAIATGLGAFAAAANLTADEFEIFTNAALENLGVNTELFNLFRDLDDGLRNLIGATDEASQGSISYRDILEELARSLALVGVVIDENTISGGDLIDIFIESGLSAEEFSLILSGLPEDVQALIGAMDPPLLEALQNVRNETLLGADAFVVLSGSIGEIVDKVTSTFSALDVGTQAADLRGEIAGVQAQIEELGAVEDPDLEAISLLETQLAGLEDELGFIDGIIQKLNKEGAAAIKNLADAALEDGAASAEELAAIFEQIRTLQEGLGEDLSEASMGVIDEVLQDLIIANVQSEEELRNLALQADDTGGDVEDLGDDAEDTGKKFVDLGIDATTSIGDIDAAVGQLATQLAELPDTISISVLLDVQEVGGLDLLKVETMHSGGVVPGQPGEESLRVLEAGELVIPAGAVNSIGSTGLGQGQGDEPRFAAVAVSEQDLYDGAILRIADLSRHNMVHVDGDTGQFRLSNLIGRG